MDRTTGAAPVALTASAQHSLIRDIVSRLPEGSQLLVPDDQFYIHTSARKQAEHLLGHLCRWLGVKPGYVRLHIAKNGVSPKTPKSKFEVIIHTYELQDEFTLAARIAYELTRYLVEVRHSTKLRNAELQHMLLEDASLACGLGILVLNGFTPHHPRRIQRRDTSLIDHYDPAIYAAKLSNYLTAQGLLPVAYQASLTPWAGRLLGVPRSRKAFAFAREAYHQERIAKLKTAGLMWCTVVLACLGLFVILQRIGPVSTTARATQAKLDQTKQALDTCQQALAYREQYTDRSDIQAMRALNADRLACQSLGNESDSLQRQLR